MWNFLWTTENWSLLLFKSSDITYIWKIRILKCRSQFHLTVLSLLSWMPLICVNFKTAQQFCLMLFLLCFHISHTDALHHCAAVQKDLQRLEKWADVGPVQRAGGNAEPCRGEGRTSPQINRGWGPASWQAALQRRSLGSWSTPSWACASSTHACGKGRWPASWAAFGRWVSPADQERWTFSCPQPQGDGLRSAVPSAGSPVQEGDEDSGVRPVKEHKGDEGTGLSLIQGEAERAGVA